MIASSWARVGEERLPGAASQDVVNLAMGMS